MENSRYRYAAVLRDIADELDPPVQPDTDPLLVRVELRRDGKLWGVRDVPLPCIGDGVFNAMYHEGATVYRDGVPYQRAAFTITVRRIGGGE